jgi:hypothetical protein
MMALSQSHHREDHDERGDQTVLRAVAGAKELRHGLDHRPAQFRRDEREQYERHRHR